ncbi:hypothetical protein BDY19DRAFT_946928 [Irpex rosettiformis]|uniref:Uncharacterized protein n=1 Tax=Irpex rosettiformis TaxID=378272 RepID=A0ACB8U4D2_9APHY|nr:hypothetical protein BDY19DRAFT_946928 [Irpex rosettiformis]
MTLGSNASPIAEETGSFGTQKKRSVPRWLPISLLAFSTVALVAPVVLLRRHKARLLVKPLEEAPPPRRTTTIAANLGAASATRPRQPTQLSPVTPTIGTEDTLPSNSSERDDNFNGALHSLKAFGYATLIVMAGGLTTVWGVKTYMGVDNTQEFAARMRSFMQKKMPGLMARLHRAPTDEDDPSSTSSESSDLHVSVDVHKGEVEWNWPDAEDRLRTAFEHGGFPGWADAMMREVEAESKIERRKRGHT